MDSSLDVLERMMARFTGPMHVRFVIQPLMAIALGIRDGIRDAHECVPPFIADLRRREGRGGKLTQAFRRMLVPIAIATVLDAIVQYMLFRKVRVLGAVIVGTVLMGVPYSIARGIANRIATARARRG